MPINTEQQFIKRASEDSIEINLQAECYIVQMEWSMLFQVSAGSLYI